MTPATENSFILLQRANQKLMLRDRPPDQNFLSALEEKLSGRSLGHPGSAARLFSPGAFSDAQLLKLDIREFGEPLKLALSPSTEASRFPFPALRPLWLWLLMSLLKT